MSDAWVEFPVKINQPKTATESEEGQLPVQTAPIYMPGPSEPQTPVTSHAPSESDSTHPTTPSSTATPQLASRSRGQPQTPSQPAKQTGPLLPVVPILPQGSTAKKTSVPGKQADLAVAQPTTETVATSTQEETEESASEKLATPPQTAPKSWADLVRSKGQSRASNVAPDAPVETGNLQLSRSESIGDVLHNLGSDVEQYGEKISFLEPRGLVNTGNMCYMNSVRQVALFYISKC
jgi:ubiquitin carboxyl-terminal hydrolase 10